MATTPVPPTERSYPFLYAYLTTKPPGVLSPCPPTNNPVSFEDLTRLVGIEDVARVVDQVHAGRVARELIRATKTRAMSLYTFCENTLFHSYLPKEARMYEVFEMKYQQLDPETKIAMYEKWLAELPYHQFTHLTSMTINPRTKRGPFVLPPEIAKFSHLTKISFSDCLLSLPKELKGLPSLTTLDLRLYSGGYGDLENFKEICRALPHLDTIIFDHGEHSAETITRFPTACIEMLRREFQHIKIEFKTIPEASWHPC